MKVYVGGRLVCEAPVVYQANGKTIAIQDVPIAIEMDSSDRVRSEAIVETATRYAFQGPGGVVWAGYIDAETKWMTWCDGASVALRSGLERDEAIEDAFHAAWGESPGGLS